MICSVFTLNFLCCNKNCTTSSVDNSTLGGFHIEMSNGSRPDNGTGRCRTSLNTRIIIGCNESVHWPDNGDVSDLILPIYDEFCQVRYLHMYIIILVM